ncbi:FAD-dependent pyridine nucleotide-disulfide oxidoreductase [Desulfosarcina variabilis str. Montpellier]|uniref:dihydrolipoyl dehydrogenase family protein n=1 Tax=Desulfosarcina variabilis TaxID=2300 RepID=UPI003AFABAA7
MAKTYDVLVIGTGTAGQTAAYALNEKGLTVAMVEHSDRPGGTCALSGCQAKKWFYEGAETVARSRHLEKIGIVSPAVASWPQLRDAKNRFTDNVPGGTVAGLKEAGIDLIKGRGRFVDQQTIAVDQQTLSARFIILATGATPMTLPIHGIEHAIDSSAFLELDDLPKRIIFIGGGFISFEFAHFAVRLGLPDTHCTILEAGPRPLGPFDAQMVGLLSDASADEGIDIHCEVSITGIQKTDKGFMVSTQNGNSFEADLVVHGAGRVPDIDALDLDRAGIEHSGRGINVDPHMLTTNSTVYAIGDCADTIQLARVADAEAQVAANNILSRQNSTDQAAAMDYSAVPAVLFTYPQYGMVGKTEQALKDEGVKYRKSAASRLSWPTYRRLGLRSAAYKVLVDLKGQVLGAHIISDNATGLVNTFALAMKNRIAVNDLYNQNVMSPYPSRESDIIYMLRPLLA